MRIQKAWEVSMTIHLLWWLPIKILISRFLKQKRALVIPLDSMFLSHHAAGITENVLSGGVGFNFDFGFMILSVSILNVSGLHSANILFLPRAWLSLHV